MNNDSNRVHILQHGKSLCDISVLHGLPGSWPPGNVWVSVADVDQATCEGCLMTYARGTHQPWVMDKLAKLVLEDTLDKDRLTFTRGVITGLLSFLKEHQNDSHRMSVVHVTEVLQSLATALKPPSKPATLDSILGTSPKPSIELGNGQVTIHDLIREWATDASANLERIRKTIERALIVGCGDDIVQDDLLSVEERVERVQSAIVDLLVKP